jgi:AAA family ATP:ADP antiporter
MRTPPTTQPRARFLPRVLGDVRTGEGRTATIMFAAVFSIMCAYYMVKPLREGWIAVSAIGNLSRVEIKAYSSLLQSLVLLAIVGAWARLAARCCTRTLLTRTALACAATLVVFWLAQPGFLVAALPGIGIVFYLWVGMFGVFIVAQFWAFATDLYADDRGRRLLPLIAIGGTAGAAAGSWLHGVLAGLGAAGTHAILLCAVLPLLAAAALARSAARAVTHRAVAPARTRAGLRHVVSDRFVLAAGMLALLLSWASTNGENLLFQAVQEGAARAVAGPGVDPAAALEQARTVTSAFYGDFYLWTNVVALLAQLLLTSRLLARGGLAAIIFVLPILALLASAVVAIAPVLAVLKWVKVAEQATDYSLNQTARQVLWLPASAEMKYESKPTVDSIFVRLGDGLAALTVLAGSHTAGHATELLVAVNLVLVALWLVTAVIAFREHGRLVAERTAAALAEVTPAVRRAVERGVRTVRRTVRRLCGRPASSHRPLALRWGDVADRLALLPIGRGHPPPVFATV